MTYCCKSIYYGFIITLTHPWWWIFDTKYNWSLASPHCIQNTVYSLEPSGSETRGGWKGRINLFTATNINVHL